MSDEPDSEEQADEVETETVDDSEEEDVPAAAGGVEDTATADGDGDEDEDDRGDETVPNVELSLYELSVRVSGRSDDDLRSVEESATRLMDYLIERSKTLEERPDERGLT